MCGGKIGVRVACRRRQAGLALPFSTDEEKCTPEVKKHRASYLNSSGSDLAPREIHYPNYNAQSSAPVPSSAWLPKHRLCRRTSQKGDSSINVSATHAFAAASSRASDEVHTNANKDSQNLFTNTHLQRLRQPFTLKRSNTFSHNTTPSTSKDGTSSQWAYPPNRSGLSFEPSNIMESGNDLKGFPYEGWSQPATPVTGKSDRSGKFAKYLKRYGKGSVENLKAKPEAVNRLSRLESGGKKMLTRVKSMFFNPEDGKRMISNPLPPFDGNTFSTTPHHQPDYPLSEAVHRRTAEGKNLTARKTKSLTGSGFVGRKEVPFDFGLNNTDGKEPETGGQTESVNNKDFDGLDGAPICADDASTIYHSAAFGRSVGAFGDGSKTYEEWANADESPMFDAKSVTSTDRPGSIAPLRNFGRSIVRDRVEDPEHSETSSTVSSEEPAPRYTNMISGLRQHTNVMEFASPPASYYASLRAAEEPVAGPAPDMESESESEAKSEAGSEDEPEAESEVESEAASEASQETVPETAAEPAPEPAPEPAQDPTSEPTAIRWPFGVTPDNVSYAPSNFTRQSPFDLRLTTDDEVYRFLKRKIQAKNNAANPQDGTAVDFDEGNLSTPVTVCHQVKRHQSFSAAIEWAGEPIAEGLGENKGASVETAVETSSVEIERPVSGGLLTSGGEEAEDNGGSADADSPLKKQTPSMESSGHGSSPLQSLESFSHRTRGLEDPFMADEPVVAETIPPKPAVRGGLPSPLPVGHGRRDGLVMPDNYWYEDYEEYERYDEAEE